MTITSVSQWSTTPADNTDLDGVSIAEGVAVISGMNNAIRNLMAQVAAAIANGELVTGLPFTIADSSSATYFDFLEDTDNGAHYVRLIGPSSVASNVTVILPSSAGTLALTSDIPSLSAYAKLDTADQTVTGGARVTSLALNSGNAVTSGTLTLDPGDRPLQHYTNGGAHTLAPGSNTGSIILDITNNGSAGAITTSGWTKVVGAFTTTNGHKFRCHASVANGGSLLSIQALQ